MERALMTVIIVTVASNASEAICHGVYVHVIGFRNWVQELIQNSGFKGEGYSLSQRTKNPGGVIICKLLVSIF